MFGADPRMVKTNVASPYVPTRSRIVNCKCSPPPCQFLVQARTSLYVFYLICSLPEGYFQKHGFLRRKQEKKLVQMSQDAKKKKKMLRVGFEPTQSVTTRTLSLAVFSRRSLRGSRLESGPLDHSGIPAQDAWIKL